MATVAQSDKHRQSGQQTVTTAAKPITQIGADSGAGTTFTATTAVDAAAWALGNVLVGDVAETSDGYKGVISEVNNGANTITIGNGWMKPDGRQPGPVTANRPADGSTITIHRNNRCKRILITADAGNAQTIYVRIGGAAQAAGDYTDYPLAAGASLTIDEEDGWLDLTAVWVIASASVTLTWILGGSGAGDLAVTINLVGSLVVNWAAFADGDTTPDVSAGTFFITANTGATIITNFDSVLDQWIVVLIEDVNTTIAQGATIVLEGGILDYGGPSVSGDMLTFVKRSGVWYEMSRSPK